MPRFAVILHGEGCRIEVDEGNFLRRKPKVESVGVYATRFVAAASEAEAGKEATKIVQEQLRTVNRSIHSPTISVESIVEDEAGYAQHAPGSGFSWYREDHESKPAGN